MIIGALRRHPWRSALGASALAVAIGVPLVAYVVVPALVKSTLVEDLPVAGAPPAASASAVSPTAAPLETLRVGQLVRISPADYGTGVVRIVGVGADRFVRFEDVDIAGAPDMYVYLSDRTDGRPGQFVDLGRLKATNGSFNHAIPPSVDLSGVRSVVVWCRQFTVTVTYAVLVRP